MYDIAIIGSGPAGATLARLLGDTYRVLLVDGRELESTSDGARPKLCGGLLAPAAQKELARQGLGLPSHVLRGPQLFAVRTLDLDTGADALYQRHYVNIDRQAFDRWLASQVGANVDRMLGWRVTRLSRDRDGVLLRLRSRAGVVANACARLVVGADGAASLVRRALVSGGAPKPYRAMQAEFEAVGTDAHYLACFGGSAKDYYGWTVPKGNRLLVGLALRAERGTGAAFDDFVAAIQERGVVLGRELSRACAPLLRPTRMSHVSAGQAQVALVGEAAGLISPSSGEGISYALRSAAILAETLEPGLDGALERYRDALLPLALEIKAKTFKSALIYSSVGRNAVMATGLGHLRRDRVEGLGGVLGEILAP